VIGHSIWALNHKTNSYSLKGAVRTFHIDCRLTHGFVDIELQTEGHLQQIWKPHVFVDNQRSFEDFDKNSVEDDCRIYHNGLVECTHLFLGNFFSKCEHALGCVYS
jgi:hypothetical protein